MRMLNLTSVKWYETGRGVVRDLMEALSRFEKSAIHGHADGSLRHRIYYTEFPRFRTVQGHVEPHRLSEGQTVSAFLVGGAEHGHTDEQFSLGVFYANGTGIMKDEMCREFLSREGACGCAT